MTTEKSREDRARRQLRRLGYRLKKMPARSWRRAYYDVGYVILDNRNLVVSGHSGDPYSDTLEQVEEFLAEQA